MIRVKLAVALDLLRCLSGSQKSVRSFEAANERNAMQWPACSSALALRTDYCKGNAT